MALARHGLFDWNAPNSLALYQYSLGPGCAILFAKLGSDLGPITPKNHALSWYYIQEKAKRLNKM